MKTIQCDISTATLIENDLLFIEIESGKDFSLVDFHQLKEAVKQIGEGRNLYLLVYIGNHTLPVDLSILEYKSESDFSHLQAVAFTIQSLPQRLFANIYLKFHSSLVKTKYFDDVESAKNWLNKVKSGEFD